MSIPIKEIVKQLIIFLILSAILLPAAPSSAAQGVLTITAAPGDTVTFSGHGPAGGKVTLSASTGLYVDVCNGKYSVTLDSVKVQSRPSTWSLSAYSVSTMTVWGSAACLGNIKITRDVPVSGGHGSITVKDLPTATYVVGVNGISNCSRVKLDACASYPVCVDNGGNFTWSVATGGMPAGVYDVKQDGVLVAIVYLGVAPPETPTPPPVPTPTPTPCPSCPPTPPGWHPGADTYYLREYPAAPGANTSDTAPPISVTVTPASDNGPANDSLPAASTLADSGGMIGAGIAALAICGIIGACAYFLIIRKK